MYIVLHVLKNSHRNVCSEVFSKVVACNMGFLEQKSSFLEVLYRSSCSLINAVMKYLNFHTSTSKLGSKLCVCVQSFLCACSKLFCVFKVICVCSKLIVNSTVLRFLRSRWYLLESWRSELVTWSYFANWCF